MSDTLEFQMTFESVGAVLRGCCGQEHEFGPCPNLKDEVVR